jgi:hypothetical protein
MQNLADTQEMLLRSAGAGALLADGTVLADGIVPANSTVARGAGGALSSAVVAVPAAIDIPSTGSTIRADRIRRDLINLIPPLGNGK